MDIYAQNQGAILRNGDAPKKFYAMPHLFKEQIDLISTHQKAVFSIIAEPGG